IMNYGKYVFELAKKEKEAKRNQKMVEIKEVWLSMTIDVGDLNVKARQAQKFLSGGNKVKVSIRMKGRQNAHANLGIEVMNKFFALVKDVGVMEKRPLTEGRSIWMMLAPIKA
ncbi:MAG: translation initiation factor IF-3, partial [Eubacteriales bacterium]